MRQLPTLSLRLKDDDLAPFAAHFPLLLYPLRVVHLSEATRKALRLADDVDLLIEARMPEVLGETPLAHWTLNELNVEMLAQANANSGALLVEMENGTTIRRVLSPFWLDWQGWTGVIHHLTHQANEGDVDTPTLRYMLYEVAQRADDPPTGLHTARAYLHTALGEAEEAAAACQAEIILHLTEDNLPSPGALDALLLLGRLLLAYNERAAARAAFALALCINANHQPATLGILPFLNDEEAVVDTLARLARAPRRLPDYDERLTQSAERLGMPVTRLAQQVEAWVREAGGALWSEPPPWLRDAYPTGWLNTLGIEV